MSKFFDETQRARQWAPQIPENGRLDVASVIDAIKLGETLSPEPAQVDSINGPEMELPQPSRGLIKMFQADSTLPASAVEAYGSLRTRVLKLKASKGIRSLMLTSSVSSEGKTLTSRNLAVSCAKLHNLRILVVDGDLRSRGLTRLLSIPEGPGLTDLLAGETTLDKAVLSTDHENLFVLGAGSMNAQPSELFASSLWAEFVASASQTYDMVIVDAPPIYSLPDAELISAGCDGVLMVVRALSRRQAGRGD